MGWFNKKEKTLEERAVELGLPIKKGNPDDVYIEIHHLVATGYNRDDALRRLKEHQIKHSIISFYDLVQEKARFGPHDEGIKITASGYMLKTNGHTDF